MLRRYHCTKCDTEWSTEHDEGCWICGLAGTPGEMRNSNGKDFIWNGFLVPASRLAETEDAVYL